MNLLDKMPLSDDRSKLELDLQMILGPLFQIIEGFTSAKAHAAFDRAKELAGRLGDEQGRYHALRGIATYSLFTGWTQQALDRAREALEVAESLHISDAIIEAHRLIGQASIYTGDLVQSLKSFDKSIELLPEIV